jgi:hypothetical protein
LHSSDHLLAFKVTNARSRERPEATNEAAGILAAWFDLPPTLI